MKTKILLSLGLMLSFSVHGQNVVVNGNFSDGLNSWSTYIADWEGVNATFSAANSEANITSITGAGAETWHVQLNQVLTAGQISSLVVGETYEITFDARSSVNGRSLKLFFGEDGGGFAAVYQQDYTLTDANAQYSATFTVGATYVAMKLGFEMGLSNDPVFIDNVVLQVSNVVTPPDQPVGLVANTPTENSIFVACGPGDVGSNNLVYRLFYAPTATAPADPQDATEYMFGTTPGDGDGVGPFGFDVTGLDAATEYTFWLYQYNTAEELYSAPASVNETTLGSSGGGGGDPMVTFRVDMSEYTGTFTTPEVNGSFNGWCGDCAAMTDMGNGIWEIVIELAPGEYEYKFSHDAWLVPGGEVLTVGSPCTITTGEFTNRTLTVGTDDMTLSTVCYGSCVACGESTTRDITFRVDMSEYNGTFTTPEVNGTFNAWCGNCAAMTDMGNGIWEITIPLDEGNYEYKFSYDEWDGQEDITGLPCVNEFNNRTLTVTADSVLTAVCYASCDVCESASINNNELSQVNIYPNPSNGVITVEGQITDNQYEIVVTDLQGRVVYTSTTSASVINENVDISNAQSGVYMLMIKTANSTRVERIVLN